MDLTKVQKQGRDERTPEDYPTSAKNAQQMNIVFFAFLHAAQSVQNSTAICGSMVLNGTIAEDEVPGTSLNLRKAEYVKVSKLKCLLAC